MVIKPIVAGLIMSGFVYGIFNFLYIILKHFIHINLVLNDITVIVSILSGGFIYMFLMIKFKAVGSEDIAKLPAGSRINSLLYKMYLLKEKV